MTPTQLADAVELTPSEMAKHLGRRGGLKGGPARALTLTAEQRSDIARRASQARWHPDNRRIYPCEKCGKLRSKNQGGVTFTVCAECWDKARKKAKVQP